MTEIYKDNFVVSLSLIIMLIFYFFRPKKINSWYGYRTINSMKSLHHWDFAQKYSSKYISLLLFVLLILQYPIYKILNNFELSSIIIMFLWFAIFVSVIILTENKLKKFNSN